MNLTIDIGNTLVKIIIFEDTVPVYRIVTGKLSNALIQRILRKFTIEQGMASAVVNFDKTQYPALKKLRRFEKLSVATSIPIKNLYKTPATLGNDRLANAIAGAFLFPGNNVLVIDSGTCIKYDIVNSKGEYLGGSISPGLEMRFMAMHKFTGKLPFVKAPDKIKLTGKSTVEAMQSGVMLGIIDEMDGFINRYSKKFSKLKVILTGGNSFHFAGDLNLSIFAAEDLVNIGLNEIIRYNSSK